MFICILLRIFLKKIQKNSDADSVNIFYDKCKRRVNYSVFPVSMGHFSFTSFCCLEILYLFGFIPYFSEGVYLWVYYFFSFSFVFLYFISFLFSLSLSYLFSVLVNLLC